MERSWNKPKAQAHRKHRNKREKCIMSTSFCVGLKTTIVTFFALRFKIILCYLVYRYRAKEWELLLAKNVKNTAIQWRLAVLIKCFWYYDAGGNVVIVGGWRRLIPAIYSHLNGMSFLFLKRKNNRRRKNNCSISFVITLRHWRSMVVKMRGKIYFMLPNM